MKKYFRIIGIGVILIVTLLIATTPALAARQNFIATLSGGQEVPSVDTNARGVAIFQLNEDGTELKYKLIASNIEDVLMSHIHLAPDGVNGPIVAWLYPDSPPPELVPGKTNGILAEGIIAAEDLVGPLAGQSLNDLLIALDSGGAYVNVHTLAVPSGEIRGQIR